MDRDSADRLSYEFTFPRVQAQPDLRPERANALTDRWSRKRNELGRFQRHDGGLAGALIVPPAEAHVAILQGGEAPVGDGHAVSLARQILEHLLRSAGQDPSGAPRFESR